MTPSLSTSTPLPARPATTAASRNSPDARGSRPTTAAGRRPASAAAANSPAAPSTQAAADARSIARRAVRSRPATPRTPSVPNRRPIEFAPGEPGATLPTSAKSALRVLRRLTGLLQAVLLALLDPGIAGQEACLLQRRAVLRVDLRQRPGDPQPKRTGLAGHAAARDAGDHIELALGTESDERLVDELLMDLVGEVFAERTAVDLPLSRARHDTDPRDGLLAPAGGTTTPGQDGPRGRGRFRRCLGGVVPVLRWVVGAVVDTTPGAGGARVGVLGEYLGTGGLGHGLFLVLPLCNLLVVQP